MGGCTTSKYAVDEDKAPKKDKKPSNKKNKKDSQGEAVPPLVVEQEQQTPNGQAATASDAEPVVKNEQETPAKDIEFIDKEDKQAAAAAAAATTSTAETKENDDTKKEVTTYQTTVVKHTQKEGDELLQHLKEEAFRSLQNLLKQDNQTRQTTTRTTTASASGSSPQTSSDSPQDNVVEQIKAQVVDSVGKPKQDTIHKIIDLGIELIKQNKVKNMNELQTSLEKEMSDTADAELIKKVINATTGFLTAKGTEAGALLSNILANASNGLTGVMNETEKTTVKVTRTVTEQIMSGGQLKEVTRVVTSNEPAPQNIQDVLRNLQNGLSVDGTPFTTTTSTLISQPTVSVTTASPTKVVTSGNTSTLSSTLVNETHETLEKKESSSSETTKVVNEADSFTKSQAEHVVSTAVNAAVERVLDESQSSETTTTTQQSVANGECVVVTNGHEFSSSESHTQHFHEENIKVEEESSVKCSTTKIVLNGRGDEEVVANRLDSFDLDQVQAKFYKHGKEAAEEVVQHLQESSTLSSSSSTFNESHKSSQQQTSSTTNASTSSTSSTTTTTATTALVTE